MHLEVGEISILKFGTKVDVLHSFSDPFTDENAATIFPHLSFRQQKTDMSVFMNKSVEILEVARQQQVIMTNSNNTMQLMLIISDGEFGSERKNLRQILRRAKEDNIFCVFLIIDKVSKSKKSESILDIQSVNYSADGKIIGMISYMDNFPFPFYIILRKLANLPIVLGDALRQWFEMVNASS